MNPGPRTAPGDGPTKEMAPVDVGWMCQACGTTRPTTDTTPEMSL